MNEDLERIMVHAGFKPASENIQADKELFVCTEDNVKRLIYYVMSELTGAIVSMNTGNPVTSMKAADHMRVYYGVDEVEWEREPKWVDKSD